MILKVMLVVAVAVVTVAVLVRALPRPDPVPEQSRPPGGEGFPWTVKTYIAAYVVGTLVYSLVSPGPVREMALTLLIALPLFFALLVFPIIRGSRVGWVIITLLTLLSFINVANDLSTAEMVVGVVNTLVYLGLLLHPETQRWCGVRLWRQPRAAAG